MKVRCNLLVKFCVLISLIVIPVHSYADDQEFDILGIKLGDNIASAKEKIKNKIEDVNFRDYKGVLKAKQYTTPELFFGCDADNQWIKYSADFSDDISIACDPTSTNGKIVGITRRYNIHKTERMLNREVFFKALFEKYGKPDAENKNGTAYLWYRETNFKSDTGTLGIGCDISSLARGSYNVKFEKKHGISLTCSVGYDNINKDIISRYELSLADNVAANECIKKVHDMIATGIADLRKKESQNAESNKPTF